MNAKPKPRTRYDDHCPCCGDLIGWDVLAKLFDGFRFDPEDETKFNIPCPHCNHPLVILGLVEFAVREVAIDEDQKPKKPKPMPVVVDSEGELFLERFDDLRSEHPLGTVFLFEGSWRGAGDGGSGFDHFYFEQATSIGPRIGVAIENVLICGAFVPTLQIPHHQAEGYLQKLKSLGYCVAVVGSSTP